jgi:hypothetical protein
MDNASDLGEALIMFWATSELFVLRGRAACGYPHQLEIGAYE